MSVQREVMLWTVNEKGEKVHFLCAECGMQRVGVVMNIMTKALLECRHRPIQKMDWDLSDVTP